jgi:RND family efflux transporter MFP subunit
MSADGQARAMTRIWLAIGAVVLIVLAFGAGFLLAGSVGATPSPQPSATAAPSARPTTTPRPTSTPAPTAPDTSVVASAVVVPVESADLALPVGGVVSDVLVVPDQQVSANQLLLRLDQSTYQAQISVAQADITHAQAAVRSAQLAVDQLPADATQDEIDAAQAQLQLAQAEEQQANARLTEAQAALKQTEVRAPFAGTVASVDIEAGEQATAGQPVVTVADLSSWLVETTDLSELQVVRIAVGDAATITFGALPGMTVEGTVTRIQLRGTSDQGGVLFAVVIRPDQYLRQLRWNMSATVHILPT